jgi:cytochrome c5
VQLSADANNSDQKEKRNERRRLSRKTPQVIQVTGNHVREKKRDESGQCAYESKCEVVHVQDDPAFPASTLDYGVPAMWKERCMQGNYG